MEDRVRRSGGATEASMSDWAQSEARDISDAARRRAQETGREIHEYATEAKEYVQDTIQQTKAYVDGAREYLGDAVQQARDKVAEYRDGGMEKMRHDVVGYTREQPMLALVIAAGVGLMLGWLSAAGVGLALLLLALGLWVGELVGSVPGGLALVGVGLAGAGLGGGALALRRLQRRRLMEETLRELGRDAEWIRHGV